MVSTGRLPVTTWTVAPRKATSNLPSHTHRRVLAYGPAYVRYLQFVLGVTEWGYIRPPPQGHSELSKPRRFELMTSREVFLCQPPAMEEDRGVPPAEEPGAAAAAPQLPVDTRTEASSAGPSAVEPPPAAVSASTQNGPAPVEHAANVKAEDTDSFGVWGDPFPSQTENRGEASQSVVAAESTRPKEGEAGRLLDAVKSGDEDTARSLLGEHSRILEDPVLKKCPPLHLAVEQGRPLLVALLLDHGINVDTPDASGRTALHLASSSGSVEITRLLYERGADIEAASALGEKPLWLAASSNREHVARFLLESEADPESLNAEASTTALLEAVKTGNTSLVKLLLESGADVDAGPGTRRRPAEGTPGPGWDTLGLGLPGSPARGLKKSKAGLGATPRPPPSHSLPPSWPRYPGVGHPAAVIPGGQAHRPAFSAIASQPQERRRRGQPPVQLMSHQKPGQMPPPQQIPMRPPPGSMRLPGNSYPYPPPNLRPLRPPPDVEVVGARFRKESSKKAGLQWFMGKRPNVPAESSSSEESSDAEYDPPPPAGPSWPGNRYQRKNSKEDMRQESRHASERKSARERVEAELAAKLAIEKELKLKEEKKRTEEAKKEEAEKRKRPLAQDKADLEASVTEEVEFVKFRDAVGRKFTFPFGLVKTWKVSGSLVPSPTKSLG